MVSEAGSRVDGDTQRTLRECLGALNESARRVVERFYFQGHSGRQIAEQEKRSEPWVRIVLLRARRALASCLEGKGLLPHG